jgi:S-formylglutathione hydrolase
MASTLTLRNRHACFGGTVEYYSHPSKECGCMMNFSVFVPPQTSLGPVPVLYYLSGLTCTEENFTTKAGAQRYAAEYGLMLVAPDTSPRGPNLPDDENAWDFGMGAGFYVDATEAPWHAHFRMYSYVVQELPHLIAEHFPIQPDRQGIFGHSMGGHGALVCALRNPEQFKSVSAFAPIVAPSKCPWGQKALAGYLGSEVSQWLQYDASELVKTHYQLDRTILIDQGTDDPFLAQQLMPELFQQACQQAGQPLLLRMQAGYDHSYFFIASFMVDHIRHHAEALLG